MVIRSPSTVSDRLDRAAEWLVILLLAFAPLAFGVVEAWSELVIVTVALLAAACVGVKLLADSTARVTRTWAYLPIVCFLVLVAGQLVPLGRATLQHVAPSTASLRSELLADIPGATDRPEATALSLYPLATRHDLRLLIALAALFFVVVNVYRRPEQIHRLLIAITVIGGAIALLAMTQDLSGAEGIYWTYPAATPVASAGPFVHYSHYSQFMNLSIGAALALLLVRLQELFGSGGATLPLIAARRRDAGMRLVWFAGAVIVLGSATVFLSFSRGGVLSLITASVFTVLMLAWRRGLRGRGWVFVVLCVGVFSCVLYTGFDTVLHRMATLGRVSDSDGGRWEILRNLAASYRKFPLFGTGMGTHQYVYPMFDHSTSTTLATHAENEYAQVLEETGVVGFVCLAVFAVLTWVAYARSIRATRVPICAAAFGIGFGLAAVMVHSFTDFGQHLPANACLSAVYCGVLVRLSRLAKSRRALTTTPVPAGSPAPLWARLSRPALAAAVLGAIAWTVPSANAARDAEAHWDNARQIETALRRRDWQGSDDTYADLITEAANAADAQPDNVDYRYWLNVYRWESINRDQTGTGDTADERRLGFAARIAEEFRQARVLCPTFGPPYCMEGQIERFVLNESSGARRIRQGYALAPCDPICCFAAGLMDATELHWDQATSEFRRCVALDVRLFPQVADVCIHRSHRPELALELARGDVTRLLLTWKLLKDQPGDEQWATEAHSAATSLLRDTCAGPDAPAGTLALLGDLCLREKNYTDAVGYFRRATALDYGQVDWRYELAKALASGGDSRQAIHEARVCLRLRPKWAPAEKLISDLSIARGPDSPR